MTETSSREDRAVQTQRLDAAAQLAGAVAHDFNNLLTAILLNADLLAGRLEADRALHPLAQNILEAAGRAADLSKQLSAFGGRQMLDIRAVDVNALLAAMEGTLRQTLGANVVLALALSPDIRAISTDPDQFGAAVLHLLRNAREAMPEGGRLAIETRCVVLDQVAAEEKNLLPGEYVSVAVGDTGAGMAADVAARAFEPFLTTKARGMGSGLGLSLVYGFTRQSGGHAELRTQPGAGTCVTLYLPRASAPAGAS